MLVLSVPELSVPVLSVLSQLSGVAAACGMEVLLTAGVASSEALASVLVELLSPSKLICGESFWSVAGPMPGTASSWARLVNAPLVFLYSMIAFALLGPIPGSVSS